MLLGQRLPQEPQFASLFCVSTQVVPHRAEVGAAQGQVLVVLVEVTVVEIVGVDVIVRPGRVVVRVAYAVTVDFV